MVHLSMVDFKIAANPICFGNISKDFSIANMKKKNKKKQDYIDMFMILFLIIGLFQLMIY